MGQCCIRTGVWESSKPGGRTVWGRRLATGRRMGAKEEQGWQPCPLRVEPRPAQGQHAQGSHSGQPGGFAGGQGGAHGPEAAAPRLPRETREGAGGLASTRGPGHLPGQLAVHIGGHLGCGPAVAACVCSIVCAAGPLQKGQLECWANFGSNSNVWLVPCVQKGSRYTRKLTGASGAGE
ncbi:uncharacterized protein LOC144179496 isoform X2 [Haemaphysalis longicornis]